MWEGRAEADNVAVAMTNGEEAVIRLARGPGMGVCTEHMLALPCPTCNCHTTPDSFGASHSADAAVLMQPC